MNNKTTENPAQSAQTDAQHGHPDELNKMPLSLADILDVAILQSLMDDFYKITHVGVGLIDITGEVLVATGWQDICTKFHRVHPETSRFCRQSDIQLTEKIPEGEYRIYKCMNNMWDMATPIVIGGRHVGNLFLGQFFFDDEVPDTEVFREQARQCGFDEKEYLDALWRVPIWSRSLVNAVMDFYTKLTHVISSLVHKNLQLNQALAEKQIILEEISLVEAKLIENAEQLRLAQEASKAGTWDWNIAENSFFWSEEFLKLFGMGPDTVPGFESWRMSLHPEDIESASRRIQEAIDQHKELNNEYRIILPSGEIRWIRATGHAVYEKGDPVRMMGLCIDISANKQIENDLRESQLKFARAFQSAPMLMAISALSDGTYREVNEEFLRTLGFTREEVIGKTSLELNIIKPGDRHRMISEISNAGHLKELELEIGTRNGDSLTCIFNANLITFEGQPHLLSSAQDITARKRAEEQLRQKEGQISSILSTAIDGFWIVDETGKILEVNPAALEILGYDREELLRLNIRDFENLESEDETSKHIERVILIGSDRFETLYRRKDGRIINVEISVIWQTGIRLFYAFLRDVTEKRKIEKELINEMTRLELLNSHMVDRELRMVELKKENAALRQKLADAGLTA